MKITDQTTLAELEVERAKLGVAATIIELDRDGLGTIAYVFGQTRSALGRGPTIATAIDDAFNQLRVSIGASVCPALRSQLTSKHVPPSLAPLVSYRCNVPMCGDSGVCEECRRRGAR